MAGLGDVREEQERLHENLTSPQARKLCELFRGRFAENVARQIIEDKGGLTEAVNFILNGDPEDVSSFLNENEDYVKSLREDSANVASLINNEIETTYRQFSCEGCQKCWWRKVPARKEVARCFGCKTKYDPIPRNKEWGWGEFSCDCGHVFRGFAIMERTISRCYKCHGPVPVDHILPPKKREGPVLKMGRRNPHNCNGVNCVHQNEFADRRQPCECIHPRASKVPSTTPGIQIYYASQRHVSTGSTVVTFLDQDSLDDEDRSVAHTLPTLHEFPDYRGGLHY